MTGLAETVAQLVAHARSLSAAPSSDGLTPVEGFGANPGALQALLHLPETAPDRAPLVVVLHGCGQSAGGYARGAGWVELSDLYGFALLCPEQVRTNNPNLCFNWFEPGDRVRDHGEAASIAQMVRFVVAEHALDPRRVFITGLSAGGAMTAVLLATYPELFAAGAVVAGLPYAVASSVKEALAAMRQVPNLSARAWGDKVRAVAPTLSQWPRISIWHGEADRTVTPAAGDALARQWCDVHGLSRGAHEPTEVDGHALQIWRRPDGDVAVELHCLKELGHGTPISAGGEDGCGSLAPWILEAGVSSSLHIARFWGIAGARSLRPGRPRQGAGRRAEAASTPASPLRIDVEETISKALRSAGLMR